mmetsp:Transcript_4277/g.7890  ORF Transcript_4277/g.7890 Transcript_4277/m.7890 type:complete len:484 (+) Transcript_4277:523-1974(+)
MVHHIVRRVAQPKQRRGRMQVRRNSSQHIDVLPNALNPGTVVEVRRANGLPHNVPRSATRRVRQLLRLHDVQQLRVHLPRLAHGLRMHEVVIAPGRRVLLLLPLNKHVQEGQVVALGHEELLSGTVGLLLAVLGAEEDTGDGQHRHDDEDLLRALQLLRVDEHLRQCGVERKLHHLPAQLGQCPGVVERPQHPELVHGVQDVVLGRRVHEVELEQILHPQTLQKQHYVAQICSLDLWDLIVEKLANELSLSEEAVAVPGTGSPSSTLSLIGVRLGNRRQLERIHSDLRVVDLELAVSGIDHIFDAVHSEGRLGNVRGHDALARAFLCTLEDLRLQVCGQLRVHREQQEWLAAIHSGHALSQDLARCFNVLLTSHEDQYITGRVGQVNGECLLDRRVNVVLTCYLGIVSLHVEGAPRDAERGGPSEEVTETVRVQSGRSNDELQVATTGDDLLQDAKEHVRVQRPLVCFVHDDGGVPVQVAFSQ